MGMKEGSYGECEKSTLFFAEVVGIQATEVPDWMEGFFEHEIE